MPEPVSGTIAAIVLAAGASARIGKPKLLLTYHGVPLLRRAVDPTTRGECHDVVGVLGADRERYLPILKGTPVRTRQTTDLAHGMCSSIRLDIETLPID